MRLNYLIYGIGFILALTSCSCSKDQGTPPIFEDTDDTIRDEDLSGKLSDDELLDLVQHQTFKYFWEGAHQASGMALERSNGDDNIVTSGGSGFGVMAIIVGVERNFISRDQALDRLLRITDFLLNSDRFHGAFPHWYYADTGKVRPFSLMDNGGDLVETSFMIQGLIAARQYFNTENEKEVSLRNKIQKLVDEVEWDWYVQPGEDHLTWHWSPNYGFEQDLQIGGYNESLITYILAVSSETHPIDPSVYHSGWTRNGNFINAKTYFGQYTLPLGYDYGGPLFFAHYSFLGLDPRGLSDTYANYWDQNVAHTLINRAYCMANPKKFPEYGEELWGLTASDNNNGYSAHSPTNDLGVITPTAALSSFPYTPTESMKVLRNLYDNKKNKLWGRYGFYDAINISANWVASSYLAIDQGPIVIMIENYRSQVIWNVFMTSTDVQNGMKKLEFSSPHFN